MRRHIRLILPDDWSARQTAWAVDLLGQIQAAIWQHHDEHEQRDFDDDRSDHQTPWSDWPSAQLWLPLESSDFVLHDHDIPF